MVEEFRDTEIINYTKANEMLITWIIIVAIIVARNYEMVLFCFNDIVVGDDRRRLLVFFCSISVIVVSGAVLFIRRRRR